MSTFKNNPIWVELCHRDRLHGSSLTLHRMFLLILPAIFILCEKAKLCQIGEAVTPPPPHLHFSPPEA